MSEVITVEHCGIELPFQAPVPARINCPVCGAAVSTGQPTKEEAAELERLRAEAAKRASNERAEEAAARATKGGSVPVDTTALEAKARAAEAAGIHTPRPEEVDQEALARLFGENPTKAPSAAAKKKAAGESEPE